MMHARVGSFSISDPEKATSEAAERTIRERVIPMLSQLDGYAGYLGLVDHANGDAKGIVFWDSEEQAQAAEETLAGRRQDIGSSMGLTLDSANLYEAIIVEMKAATRV